MGLCCYTSYIWTFLAIAAGCAIVNFFTKKKKDLQGKHVMITGGSSGIGLSVAHEVARRGASVMLVARNEDNLRKAQSEVEATMATAGHKGSVQIKSVDVSGDPEKIKDAVQEAEAALGPVYMLVNCAGFSRAHKFEDISPKLLKQMLDVNFVGSFFMTQAAIASMKRQREGIVVLTSSQAGLLGLYGFTAYSAAKAALVKMAEALHMEVKPYNISVTVCYPPDTDTPGFEEENKDKPAETSLISEAAGLFMPDHVAHKLVEDAVGGTFSSTVGLEGFMLTTLCAGMGPITDIGSFLSQVFLSGLFRSISAFYLWSFSSIVAKEQKKREEEGTEDSDKAAGKEDLKTEEEELGEKGKQ